MARRSHGQSKTTTYNAWVAMRSRCYKRTDKYYSHYGGRGIRVCDRWLLFENFYTDMGPRPSPDHSLDRINNDGNYGPDNCRWATQAEQQRNRSNTVLITINGVTKCAADWADEMGMLRETLSRRMRRAGWTGERAVLTPVGPYKKRAEA
jgi:hypothetical protein